MLKTGKIPPDLLKSLLEKYKPKEDPRLVVGPKIGEDAAVIDFGDKYLVFKTDPITAATDAIGWYVVNINANDIATRGAKPKWFQATILLPENKTDENLVKEIFSQISHACRELDIALVGGHTEVTYNLDRPIVVGSMLGEVEKEKLVTTSGAKVGDVIVLAKGIAAEATSLIAREKEEELSKKYSRSFLEKCKGFLFDPGISVVKEALLANSVAKINSMHDPTEGGLATGLYEIAEASGKGLLIYKEKIPIFEECRILCEEYGLNPLGALASGALLITLPEKEAEKLLKVYAANGIKAEVIGKIMEKSYGMKIEENGKIEDLKYSERDEILKIFE